MGKHNYLRIVAGMLFIFGTIIGIVLMFAYFAIKYKPEIECYGEYEFFGIKGILSVVMLTVALFILFSLLIGLSIIGIHIMGKRRIFANNIIKYTRLRMDDEWFDPLDKKGNRFTCVSDERLVVTKHDRKFNLIAFPCGIVICIILLIAEFHDKEFALNNEYSIFATSIIFLFAAFLYNLFCPPKRLVFDRMNGVVTFPSSFIFPSKTIPFEKVNTDHAAIFERFKGITHPTTMFFIDIPGGTGGEEYWSFYVWYMDKNRPLPTGTLLDPYREKDFLRRKAEGFPPPKYESYRAISDDRTGYLYATDDFKERVGKVKVGIPDAYDEVYFHIKRREKRAIEEESIVLVGIWKNDYVFREGVPPNPMLRVFREDEDLSGSYLVDMSKSRVSRPE